MTARQLLDQGDLGGAIRALNDEVKQRPADQTARTFLFELLCYQGDFDRAGRQLEVIGKQATDAGSVQGVQVYHGLLQAEQARARLFEAGQSPRFLFEPPADVRLHLEAVERIRQGQPDEARRLLDEAARTHAAVAGTCGDQPFDDIRDADDLLAPVLEVFSSSAYFWVPWVHLQYLEIPKPQTLRDLLWIPAKLATHDGQVGEVYLPNLYPGTPSCGDDLARLGRKTDWTGEEAGIIRGLGQKLLLVGEDARTLLELETVRLTFPAGEPGADAPAAESSGDRS